jgi:hypothetical protein
MYLVTGATNNGGEDSTRCVVPSESGLAHACIQIILLDIMHL